MKSVGIILIVTGLLALVFGGITYTREKTILDAGPIQATVDQKKKLPIPPIAGGLAVLAGAAMVVTGRRQPA